MLLLRQFKSLTNGRMSMNLSNYPPGHPQGLVVDRKLRSSCGRIATGHHGRRNNLVR